MFVLMMYVCMFLDIFCYRKVTLQHDSAVNSPSLFGRTNDAKTNKQINT